MLLQNSLQKNNNFSKETWEKLPNLVEEVIRSGGNESIEYNYDNITIKFVGMIPHYAKKYIDSAACIKQSSW